MRDLFVLLSIIAQDQLLAFPLIWMPMILCTLMYWRTPRFIWAAPFVICALGFTFMFFALDLDQYFIHGAPRGEAYEFRAMGMFVFAVMQPISALLFPGVTMAIIKLKALHKQRSQGG